MADPWAELVKVRNELLLVEQQLESLLERQSELLDKKAQLESAIVEADKEPDSDQNRDWEKTNFDWSKRLEDSRSKVFNVQSFRPLQLSTMNATLAGRDCILVMPTGGGKSLCFQLPAVISKGLTLVVSPLVSLMEDQLMSLKKLGVEAEMLSGTATREHVNAVHASMTAKNSQLKLLYVTPEKLAKSKRFMNKLEKTYEAGNFSRLVIDEVHCCSQWGHDFRPDYKFLGVMRRQFPGVPILGLTATATNAVLKDVKKILQITNCIVFRASFNRTNLYYEVYPKPSNFKAGMDEVKKIIDSRFRGESGIIYCFSRKDTEEVARELMSRKIRAGCYHADMQAKDRSHVHQAWMSNSLQVVVATIAFGMGIDKPDVRFVIHHSMSKSMENYYQESGRAGRDDEKATCILFCGFGDTFRQSSMVFTEQTGLEKLYAMVAYAQDVGTCRRTLIARHFGERWNPDECNKMCDHCSNDKGAVVKKDITQYCQDILKILENAQAIKQRITSLKLLEAWQGKGSTILRVKSVTPPRLTPAQCERVLAHMLVEGYTREDFHFTPYSTISYQLPGPRSAFLNSDEYKVKLNFFDKSAKPSTSTVTHSASTASASTTSASKISNSSDKSKAPIKSDTSSQRKNRLKTTQKSEPKKFTTSDTKKSSKKRKPMVIDSDSDDDFYGKNDDSQLPTKKVKMGRSATHAATSQSKANDCIVLDDSDNELEKSRVKKVSGKGRISSDIEEISDVYMNQLAKADEAKVSPDKGSRGSSKETLSESFNSNSGLAQLNLSEPEKSESEGMQDSEDEYDQIQTMYAQQLSTL